MKLAHWKRMASRSVTEALAASTRHGLQPGVAAAPRLAFLSNSMRFRALATTPCQRSVEELKKGKELNGKTYKVHLDGYDQTAMLTKGAESSRREVWYFAETTLGAARVGNFKYTFLIQPDGWFGPKVKGGWPGIVNLRLDPFVRTTIGQSLIAYDWWAYEFWRFVFVQEEVAKLAKTAIEFPPMQEGASFDLSARKKKLDAAQAAHAQ